MFTIVITFVFGCFSISNISMATTFADSKGTVISPYKVSTYSELNAIRNNPGANFIQTNDIVIPENAVWTPVNNFTGNYNGNGYTIDGLKVAISNKTNDIYAAFIINNSGYIHDVEFNNCSVSAYAEIISTISTYKSYSSYASCIVSNNNGTIERCGVSGYISSSSGLNAAYCGGLVLNNQGNIASCYNKCRVSAYNGANTAYAGGIASTNNGTIINSYNMGYVSTGGGSGTAGGIVGSGGANIKNCYNSGDVAANNEYSYTLYAGGVLGGGGTTEVSYWNIDSNQTIQTTSLSNTNKKGVGFVGYGGKDTTVSKTANEMKETTFVELLNQPLEEKVWLFDTNGINNGYPILSFQNKIACSLPSGSYSNVQTMSLNAAIEGSEILYSVDGSEPYLTYVDPIEIYKTTTVQVVVRKDDVLCGNYLFYYTIPLPKTISSIEPGSYDSIQTVSLDTNISNCDIYYTIDGSNPTLDSTRYTGPIEIYKTTTLNTIAVKNDVIGPVSTYNYSLPNPVITVSKDSGVYNSEISVEISVEPSWYNEIYYTLDGSMPTKSSQNYSKAIEIDENCVLNMLTCYDGREGTTAQWEYQISPTIETDVLPGSYNKIQNVSLTSSIPSYDMYYTTDGTPPSISSNKYSAPIEVYCSTTIKAMAVKNNTQGDLFSFNYTLPTPTISGDVASGSYSDSIRVTLNSNVSWYDKIYYTLDGTEPDNTSEAYNQPIYIDENTTLKAVSYYKNSAGVVKQFIYSFTPIANANVDSGTYNEIKSIVLNSTIQGYDIYYTTDGSNPQLNGIKYSQPLELYKTTTLKTVSMKNNTIGAVKTYTYTFPKPEILVNNSIVYSGDKKVDILANIYGYDIYYTTDGSIPNAQNGIKYSVPFDIDETTTLKIIAIKEEVQSDIKEVTLYKLPAFPLKIRTAAENQIKLAHGESNSFALCSNGTVQSSYSKSTTEYKTINKNWRMIEDIAAGRDFVIGLQANGQVCAVGDNADNQCNTENWKDIVSITAGAYHAIGLKKDGTVVSTNPVNNKHNQDNVEDWSDIVAVSAGAYHTLGLKSDGTVVAVGTNTHAQCETSSWTSIVDISAGASHSVGLKSDGRVVATGNNYYGQCNVEGWEDIVEIYAQATRTIGRKADGTYVSTDNSTFDDLVRLSEGYSDSNQGTTNDNMSLKPISGEECTMLYNGKTIGNLNYLDDEKYEIVDLKKPDNTNVLFTIDGSDPKIYGFVYTEPFVMTSSQLRMVPVEDGTFQNEVVYYYDINHDIKPKIVSLGAPLNQNNEAVCVDNIYDSEYIELNMYNTYGEVSDFNVYTATFSKGNLVDINMNKYSLLLGESKIKIPLDFLSNASNIDTIKILMWNDNLKPYTKKLLIKSDQ